MARDTAWLWSVFRCPLPKGALFVHPQAKRPWSQICISMQETVAFMRSSARPPGSSEAGLARGPAAANRVPPIPSSLASISFCSQAGSGAPFRLASSRALRWGHSRSQLKPSSENRKPKARAWDVFAMAKEVTFQNFRQSGDQPKRSSSQGLAERQRPLSRMPEKHLAVPQSVRPYC